MGVFSFWGLGFRVMDCCDDGKFVGVMVWDLCTRWERDWSIDRASEQWYCWLKSSWTGQSLTFVCASTKRARLYCQTALSLFLSMKQYLDWLCLLVGTSIALCFTLYIYFQIALSLFLSMKQCLDWSSSFVWTFHALCFTVHLCRRCMRQALLCCSASASLSIFVYQTQSERIGKGVHRITDLNHSSPHGTIRQSDVKRLGCRRHRRCKTRPYVRCVKYRVEIGKCCRRCMENN